MTITGDSFASLIHCQPGSQFKLAQDVPCTECPEVLRETFRTNEEWEGDKVPQTLMRAGDAEESDPRALEKEAWPRALVVQSWLRHCP